MLLASITERNKKKKADCIVDIHETAFHAGKPAAPLALLHIQS